MGVTFYSKVFMGLKLTRDLLTRELPNDGKLFCRRCDEPVTSRYCPDCGEEARKKDAFKDVCRNMVEGGRDLLPPNVEVVVFNGCGHHEEYFLVHKKTYTCLDDECPAYAELKQVERKASSAPGKDNLDWFCELVTVARKLEFSVSADGDRPRWWLVHDFGY